MEPFRIAVIAIAAYVIIGLAPFLESGQFVLPIGLFKPTFFIIAVLGFIQQKKRLKFNDYVLLLWSLLFAFTSKFIIDLVWGASMTPEATERFFTLQAWLHLLAYLILMLWMTGYAWRKMYIFGTLQLIGATGMLACLLLNFYIWLPLPALLWFIGVALQKEKEEVPYAIAVFMIFFICSAWISGCFFGADAILLQL